MFPGKSEARRLGCGRCGAVFGEHTANFPGRRTGAWAAFATWLSPGGPRPGTVAAEMLLVVVPPGSAPGDVGTLVSTAVISNDPAYTRRTQWDKLGNKTASVNIYGIQAGEA